MQIAGTCAKMRQMQKSSAVEQLRAAIASADDPLKLSDVESLLANLEEKRKDMQHKESSRHLEVLLHFLEHSRQATPSC